MWVTLNKLTIWQKKIMFCFVGKATNWFENILVSYIKMQKREDRYVWLGNNGWIFSKSAKTKCFIPLRKIAFGDCTAIVRK